MIAGCEACREDAEIPYLEVAGACLQRGAKMPTGVQFPICRSVHPLLARWIVSCRVSSMVICFFVTARLKYVRHLLILKASHDGHRVALRCGLRLECPQW